MKDSVIPSQKYNFGSINSTPFDADRFLADLDTFIRFKTCVDQNRSEFAAARTWIQAFFDPAVTAFETFTFEGFTSLLIRPRPSDRPRLLGDGHIEVVPGGHGLFALRQEGPYLYGRGVADMKTQCLMMMTVLRDLLATGKANDFWLLLSEDEEIGSTRGARRTVELLDSRDCLPDVIFAPDGGPDFAYVEKEKGMISFDVTVPGQAAHGSRPFLGVNAIERMMALYADLQARFPNPRAESYWVPSLSMTRIDGGLAHNQIPDRCRAGFDLRFTETTTSAETVAVLEEIGQSYGATFTYREIGIATYYPRERPLARRYIDLLRHVSGKEPPILHSNGASNARFYVMQKRDVQILMSNPTVVGAHADTECLDARSLPAYYQLVHDTVQLV
jgi:succinyl-diaminopimelate desuccinylase